MAVTGSSLGGVEHLADADGIAEWVSDSEVDAVWSLARFVGDEATRVAVNPSLVETARRRSGCRVLPMERTTAHLSIPDERETNSAPAGPKA